MPSSLDQWVAYIQTLHARTIDLGLDRVRQVYQRLFPEGIAYEVVSIAGTNGKGSCAELLRSIYAGAGYRTGKYTSPHLVDFNERIVINERQVDTALLLEAFEIIEVARGDITLTYFEFATLVAIWIFDQSKVDIAIMEVGLGGRLDAVNILDSQVSLVTSISIDHRDWLGDTIEEIAAEKIAIATPDTYCVTGVEQPVPDSMRRFCAENNVKLLVSQLDFTHQQTDQDWSWRDDEYELLDLPLPFKQSDHQVSNAALVVQAVQLLQSRFPVSESALREGIKNARLAGRCQIVSREPFVVYDVSHNPASVQALARFVRVNSHRQGKVIAVCGMLKDKDIKQSLAALVNIVDEWHVCTLNADRSASASYLSDVLQELFAEKQKTVSISTHANPKMALAGVKNRLNLKDCLLVFGSFYLVGDIIRQQRELDPVKLIRTQNV